MDSEDARWMRRALQLATQGFTPPNPRVGCVIVRDNSVVGEGFHPYAGQPHAEVFALRQAGEQARGATAYVSLEPCSHWGRTPPCADALIAAEVARVVAAVVDNDPRVGGRGVAKLQAAGIEVTVGVLEAQARRQNEAFFHFHAHQEPFVTLKAALTLDGKIATRTGNSQWITGPESRQYVHRLRAQSGAVLVGVGTLLADNAALNARLPDVDLPRQPLRVVVDSQLRTPPDARAVQIAGEAPELQPLLLATTEQTPLDRERALQLPGVEVARLPATPEGRVDLHALRALLTQRQIISVFCEGGGQLHAAMLAAGWAHKALFFVAPKIVGGRDAPTPVAGEGVSLMSEACALDRLRLRRFGNDVALEGYFVRHKA